MLSQKSKSFIQNCTIDCVCEIKINIILLFSLVGKSFTYFTIELEGGIEDIWDTGTSTIIYKIILTAKQKKFNVSELTITYNFKQVSFINIQKLKYKYELNNKIKL